MHPLLILLAFTGTSPSTADNTVVSHDDWSIPRRFTGRTVAGRLKGFPHRIVALTFDDGPDARNTRKVLDALHKHKARATFFLIGKQVAGNANLVRRMVKEGHVVGNHSWSHRYRLSVAEGEAEITKTDKATRTVIGSTPACFRSPGGFTNNGIAKEARKRGLPNFLWMVSSADTTKIGPSAISQNVVKSVQPGDIVLMHDGPGHHNTALAVPAVLEGLERKGYRFVTIPELCRAWDAWLTARGIRAGLQPAPGTKSTATEKPRKPRHATGKHSAGSRKPSPRVK